MAGRLFAWCVSGVVQVHVTLYEAQRQQQRPEIKIMWAL